MPEDKTTDNFEALQKQLAKDALGKALKELHSEITRDIERNKTTFSEEIKTTLVGFKEALEKSVAEEIDRKISALFAQHFSDTSTQVKANFHEMFSQVQERTKEDMQRLHTQGEDTLQAWKGMMTHFSSLWTKPFVALIVTVAFMGSMVCLYFFLLTSSPLAFLLMNDAAKEAYRSELNRIRENEKYRAIRELSALEAKSQANNQTKSDMQTKPKKK